VRSFKSLKLNDNDDGFHGEIQLPNASTCGGLECALNCRGFLVYRDNSGIVPSSIYYREMTIDQQWVMINELQGGRLLCIHTDIPCIHGKAP
jgi:hypothetical protein